MQSPKRLLVVKNYLAEMKKFRVKHKEQKQIRKMVQQVVNDYLMKRESVKNKELEIRALEDALRTARGELADMEQDLQQFKAANAEIVSQVKADEGYVDAEVEPVVEELTDGLEDNDVAQTILAPQAGADNAASSNQLAALAQQQAAYGSDPDVLESYGLESAGHQKSM